MGEGGAVRVGMKVRSADGADLGKVIAATADEFVVEKGLFFPKDYRVDHHEVRSITGGEVWLASDRDRLRELPPDALDPLRPAGGYRMDESDVDREFTTAPPSPAFPGARPGEASRHAASEGEGEDTQGYRDAGLEERDVPKRTE